MIGFESDLDIAPTGEPMRPMVFVQLDEVADQSPDRIVRTAELLRRTLPVTVGILHDHPPARLSPVLDALSCTVTTTPDVESRQIVQVQDLDAAVAALRTAARRSPSAFVACGQLLRQTVELDTTRGLAAEAAVYSMLLGGDEFAGWLTERGTPRPKGPPDHPLIRLVRTDSHLSIVLNDPKRRNALSFRLREELLEAVGLAALDPSITSIEITGAGPSFCSGGDLDEFGTATDLVAAYFVRLARAPWRIIDQLADRVTMRIHGGCIGAGAELAAFAGTLIAAPDTFFEFPEVRMGLVPGAGGTVSVPRRIGRWRATWLMLTGHRLDAETALRWGLVDATGPDGAGA